MGKELELYGWMMWLAQHKMMHLRAVLLGAGGPIIVHIQRMLVSHVEVSASIYKFLYTAFWVGICREYKRSFSAKCRDCV